MLYTVLIVFHIVLAAALIAIVLVQRGPGATMGAAFGAGASGTVFGSRGSASFLTRATSWLGVAFFAISLSMAVIVARSGIVTVSPDDLGVAGAIQTIPAAEQVESGEDEFLFLPEEDALPEEEPTAEDEFIPEPPES
jgi:preprotein translocase subunit SecG